MTKYSISAKLLYMMTQTTAAAIEAIRRQLRTLRAIAENTQDWQDAEAIHATAGEIRAQLEAIELDAQDENTEGELLAA